jgi:pyruvate, water dikinase
MGFDHMKVAVYVGIQKMVRSDRASAGVLFTLDPTPDIAASSSSLRGRSAAWCLVS